LRVDFDPHWYIWLLARVPPAAVARTSTVVLASSI